MQDAYDKYRTSMDDRFARTESSLKETEETNAKLRYDWGLWSLVYIYLPIMLDSHLIGKILMSKQNYSILTKQVLPGK